MASAPLPDLTDAELDAYVLTRLRALGVDLDVLQQSGGVPLPLGGLLGGLPFGEERLISLAAAYQAVTPWHRRRPTDPETTDAPGAWEARENRLGRRRLDVLDVMMECE